MQDKIATPSQCNVSILASAVALSAAMVSGSALAYEKGDIILRAGAAMVDPQDSSSMLSLDGAVLTGTQVTVDDNTQLGLTLTYMLLEDVGISVLGATPFSHTVTAEGAPVDGIKTAEVKHLPPTVTLNYFLMSPESKFQPYVGMGFNYTVFFSEELEPEFVDALGEGNIELKNSFGFALNAGVDVMVTDNIVLNAAIWSIDLDTEATINLDSGSTIKSDVEIDPLVYMVGVGYKF